MTDAQLKKLCAGWRKAAKWWRGDGFALKHPKAAAWRIGMAKVFEHCANELSAELRKAGK